MEKFENNLSSEEARKNSLKPEIMTTDATRRGFLAAAATGLSGVALPGASSAASGAGSKAAGAGAAAVVPLVHPDGTYDTVPLAKETVSLAVMQTRVMPVDAASPEKGRRENVAHMLDLIDGVQTWSAPKDLLFFHEFPITGFRFEWTREEALGVAIELPGVETEALGKAALKYHCYIVFGSYVRDVDWPGHLLSVTTIIGPDGRIVDTHWKPRNVMGLFEIGTKPVELMTSTIYNCYDRYVEMYGLDRVIPVTRTPIGNLCMSSAQSEFELFRSMALKGGEIFLRTASGGFIQSDMWATAYYNKVYCAICSNSVSPGVSRVFEDAGSGGSTIYGPRGEVLATARSPHEQAVEAAIPIAAFRARHRIPDFSWPLYKPVYDQYVQQYPASKFTKNLPASLQDAAKYLRPDRNWK